MTIVADEYPFVIGVDTHAKKHVYSIVAASGKILGTRDFPTTKKGLARATTWVGKTTGGDADSLWAIEGTGTYGMILTDYLTRAGYQVIEAPWTGKSTRGKTDQIDAAKIARTALSIETSQMRHPRATNGIRVALATLVSARNSMTTEKTKTSNRLTALLRSHDLGIDVRRAVNATQTRAIASWRITPAEIGLTTLRREARRLARNILDLKKELAENYRQLKALVPLTQAAVLLDEKGYGPVSIAQIIVSYSHAGRITSEAKFAALAGVNPIPASSGNTVRHRLNRRGDRQLNRAIHTIAMVRMRSEDTTKTYVTRRRQEGKTDREIRRCLKRFIARHIYKTLQTHP